MQCSFLLQKQNTTAVTIESNITQEPGTSDQCTGTVNAGCPSPPPLDYPKVWSLKQWLGRKNKHPWIVCKNEWWDVQFVPTFQKLTA